MASRSVRVDILGDASGVKRAAAEAEGSLARLKTVAGEALGEAGLGGFGRLAGIAGIAAATAASVGLLVHGIKDLVGAGLAEEASLARLDTALKNTHLLTQANTKAIEEYADAQRKRGFTDEQTRDALSREVIATHNVTDAMKLNNLASDLARTRHIDLATAAGLAIKVFDGNTRVLKQLGIVIQPVTDNVDKLKESTKHATKEQLDQAKAADKLATTNKALNAVMQATHGQADAFAKTDAGKIAAFGAQWDHLKEVVGKAVLPVVTGAIDGIGKAIAWLKDWWDRHSKAIEQTARQVWASIKTIVIDHVTAIWHAVQNAMKIIKDIIDAVMAIITGHWGDAWKALKKLVADTLAGIGQAIVDAAKTLWDTTVWLGEKLVDGIISGLGGLMDALVNAIKGAISGAVSAVLGWVGLGGLISGGTPATPAQQRSLARSNPLLFGGLGATPAAAGAGGGGSTGGGSFGGGGGTAGAPPQIPTGTAGLAASRSTLGLPPSLSAPGSLGTVNAKAGKAAKKNHGLDLRAAISFAQGQLGKPYVRGGGHGPVGTYPSYDCSGFASQVASRVKGYTGGIGTSEALYRTSSPSKGDEPVLFGFRDFLSDGPGHMAIKLEGTVYSSGGRGGGVHQGIDPVFNNWMIPAGLEGIDVLADEATAPRALSAGQVIAGMLRTPAGVAAVGALGLTQARQLAAAGKLAQAPALAAAARSKLLGALRALVGTEHVPSAGAAPSAEGSLAEKQAQLGGEQAARAAGEMDPAKIQAAGEKALNDFQLKTIQAAAAAVGLQMLNAKTAWLKAEKNVQTILSQTRRKGAGTPAERKAILDKATKAAVARDKLADTLSGLEAQYADLQAQAKEKGWDIAHPDLGSPGPVQQVLPDGSTVDVTIGRTDTAAPAADSATTPSAQAQAIIDQTVSQIQTGVRAAGADALFSSALSGMNFTQIVNTLVPSDPSTLAAVAAAAVGGFSLQGYAPATSGSAGI